MDAMSLKEHGNQLLESGQVMLILTMGNWSNYTRNYQEQVRFTESVGLTSRSTPGQVKQDLATILKSIDLDLKFLKESRRANDYKHHKFINFYV